MKIRSVEFSKTFLKSLDGLPEDAVHSVVDRVSLKTLESAKDSSALLADDAAVVGRMIVDNEDGTTAIMALKLAVD